MRNYHQRRCRRCGKLYATRSKFSKICDDCKDISKERGRLKSMMTKKRNKSLMIKGIGN